MKKTLLLLAAVIFTCGAFAQESHSSILFNGPRAPHNLEGHQVSSDFMKRMQDAYLTRVNGAHSAAKTTAATPHSDWYDQWNQNQGGTPLQYYFAIFPDSNIVEGGHNTWCHGFGTSFDPTDSSYFDSTFNGATLTTAIVPHMADTMQAYTIDSFYIPVSYQRMDPTAGTVDSLIIELVCAIDPVTTTTDTGAYNLQFTTAAAGFFPFAADSKPRFADVHYNSGCGMRPGYNVAPFINDCYFDSVFVAGAYKQRIAIPLSAAAVADTDANGLLNLGHLHYGTAATVGLQTLGITPVALKTSRHQHMVSYVTFKSGHAGGTYPLGTTAANWMKLFAGSPNSSGTSTSGFRQNAANPAYGYNGSYQASLITQQQTRYSDTEFTYPHGTHDILIPSSDFDPAAGFEVVAEAFHVTWTANPTLGINNVNNSLENVVVYPNPAKNIVNVSYKTTATTPVTVTLTNMVGQVIATQTGVNGNAVFNTTEIASGIYIYTLEANGARTTGRVSIAH